MQKILLLLDSPSHLYETLPYQLGAEGYKVVVLGTRPEQWVYDIARESPDLVLLEVSENTYTDRYRFCHQFRQNSDTAYLPIILLGEVSTSYTVNSMHYLLEGLHMGASDYLTPPFNLFEMVSKIKSALRVKTWVDQSRVLTDQLNRVNAELYQRNVQVEKELYIARQLQQSLLPSTLPLKDVPEDLLPTFSKVHFQDEKLKITGIYLPCDTLGGDLYDIIPFRDGTLGISITDVSGHGVPAGFITAIFKTSLYRITHQMGEPADVLAQLNNELFDIVKTGDYVTSLYLRINQKTMQVDCSGAGHPYPFYYCAQTGTMTRLQENATPLVWVKDMVYPQESITLSPGDKLFLFTDGVSELKNPALDMFGEDRLEVSLREAFENGTTYVTDALIEELSNFAEGSALEDDISMVMIEAL